MSLWNPYWDVYGLEYHLDRESITILLASMILFAVTGLTDLCVTGEILQHFSFRPNGWSEVLVSWGLAICLAAMGWVMVITRWLANNFVTIPSRRFVNTLRLTTIILATVMVGVTIWAELALWATILLGFVASLLIVIAANFLLIPTPSANPRRAEV